MDPQGVLDPSGGQLSLTLDLHDAAADVPGRVASFLQVRQLLLPGCCPCPTAAVLHVKSGLRVTVLCGGPRLPLPRLGLGAHCSAH